MARYSVFVLTAGMPFTEVVFCEFNDRSETKIYHDKYKDLGTKPKTREIREQIFDQEGMSRDGDFSSLDPGTVIENDTDKNHPYCEMDYKINIKDERDIFDTGLPNEREHNSMHYDTSYVNDTTTAIDYFEIKHKINIKDELDILGTGITKQRNIFEMHNKIAKEEVKILNTALQSERACFSTDFGNKHKNNTVICSTAYELDNNTELKEWFAFSDVGLQNEENGFYSELGKKIKAEFVTYNEKAKVCVEKMSQETELQSEEVSDFLKQNENMDGNQEELELADSSRLCNETVCGDSNSESAVYLIANVDKETSFCTGKDHSEYESVKTATKTLVLEKQVQLEQSVKGSDLKQQYKSEICDKSFNTLSSLKTHKLNHEGKMPHRCGICDKSFTQLKTLKQHNLIHGSKKQHKCGICDKSFTRLSNLKRHNLIHEGKKPHKCKICDKSFTQLSNLKHHNLIHEGIKSHRCGICGKSFTQLKTLKQHNLIHEGKKSHKCGICEKSFTQLSTLKHHSLIHGGRKSHKCEICSKSFSQLSYLKQHKLIHEGKKPHKCDICDKSFIGLSGLKYHNWIHEGKKPHKCEICDKSFSQFSLLKRHNLIHESEKFEICNKSFSPHISVQV